MNQNENISVNEHNNKSNDLEVNTMNNSQLNNKLSDLNVTSSDNSNLGSKKNLANKNSILNENNFFNSIKKLEGQDPNELNTPIKLENHNNKDNSVEEYYNVLCEHKGSEASIIYNIITDLIGLYLAYRTFVRLPYGFATYSFVFFYGIIAIVAVYELFIQVALSKKKSKEVCHTYYRWLDKHSTLNTILIVIRWILFITIIVFGFFSTFMDLDYKKLDNSRSIGPYLSLYNNRNYRKNTNRNNNRNNNRNVRNQKYNRN